MLERVVIPYANSPLTLQRYAVFLYLQTPYMSHDRFYLFRILSFSLELRRPPDVNREAAIFFRGASRLNPKNMKRKDYSYAGLTLLVEVRVPVLLKVKAYTRVRCGKTEKVSSYYRRIGVRK